jgi:outer membrane lipoprotein-sorting protein
LLSIAVSCSCALFAQTPNVDEIVSKHLAAMGGSEKIRAIRTSKATGKVIFGGGQAEATMVAYSRRPAQNRVEVNMQGQRIVQAFDGQTAWMINPMTGNPEPQKMPADESKRAADDADPDGSPLIDYKAKGNKIEYIGKEDVEGAMAHKLKVTLKSGSVSTLYLDEKTMLPSKSVTARKQMGQEMELEAYPSNYKPVEGVMMPFTSEIRVGGRAMMQNLIEKIEINVPVDESMFAFPAPATAGPKPPVAPPK